MTQFSLPTVPDYKNYSFAVELDGETYTLTLYFNARDNAYYLSVEDSLGVAVVSGRKVSANAAMFLGRANANLPGGEILVLDTEGLSRPPVVGELGTLFELLYIDEAEVDAL